MSGHTPRGRAAGSAAVLALASLMCAGLVQASAPGTGGTALAPADPAGPQVLGPSVDIRSKRLKPPVYPLAALRIGAAGTVHLRVAVDAEGRMQDVEVETSSGNADLDAAAKDAARGWSFSPGRRGDEAVAGTLLIPVDFGPAG